MAIAPKDLGHGWFFFQRGWLNGNHLASLGKETILIDSGYLEGLDQTLALLGQAGVDPARVDRLLTTHVHCDHVGGHAAIHQASGCRVELSEVSRRVIENQDLWAAWPAYYGQAYRFFPTHSTIAPGDRMDLNGLAWLALDAPGHAAGQLCFFCPDLGWLVAADAVWDNDFGVLNLCVEGHDAALRQRETLRTLAGLPVTMVIPGHGPLLPDGGGAIAKCLSRVEGFLADPGKIWRDQMRKILLYTVMMHQPVAWERYQVLVLGAPWFQDACRRFFPQDPAKLLQEQLAELVERGLVRREHGSLSTPLPV